MYVSVSNIYNIGCDGIGVYFSQDSVLYNNPFYGVLNYIPYIQNPTGNIITDTVNWTKTEGEFVASGGERYITIGNFKTDNNTQTVSQGPSSFSYFYIDDVSVTEGSCNVGIKEESNFNFTIQLIPNPAKDHFQISIADKSYSNLQYQIFGIEGRRVQDGILQRNVATVSCCEWQSGLYLVLVYDPDGNVASSKILKL